MQIHVHCPSCQRMLKAPTAAAGHSVQCPKCLHKFRLHKRQELIDNEIFSWIEDDVNDFEQTQEQELEKNHQEQEQVSNDIPRHKTAGQDFLSHLKTHHPPAIEQPTAAPASDPKSTPASAMAPQKSPQTLDPRAIAYQELSADCDRPQLFIEKCDPQGVTFLFESTLLCDENFRASMPPACVFTAQTSREDLYAKPLAFIDRSQATNQSIQSIEAEHQRRLLPDQSLKDLLPMMGVLEDLPGPFNLAMPYFVERSHLSASLDCHTHTRPDGNITCHITLPHHAIALEWFLRVNGMCSDDYHNLRQEIALIANSAWQKLPEASRQNIQIWCHLAPTEQMQIYISDSDMGQSDHGLAGIIITDQRMIFHKYHHEGQIPLTQKATLTAQPRTTHYTLSLNYDRHQTRVGHIHLEDLDSLAQALAQSAIEVTVVSAKLDEPK